MSRYRLPVVLLFIFIGCMLLASFITPVRKAIAPNKKETQWVDSVFNSLTLDQKIGQLMMVPVYSNKPISHRNEIAKLITEEHIGGLIMMQGGPARQVNWLNYLQSKTKTPLIVAQDAEWGLGMRLDSTISFPRQMLMGAIHDPDLIYEFGKEVARQCKRVGVHINFAPVVDINNNPKNPVINDRAFSENRYNVTLRGLQYMNGLQENGIIACAKHFPGHGDTDKDSHHELPVISHDKQRLDSLELFPFKILIQQGIMSIMSAHLYIPSLDKKAFSTASLSEPILTGLLRNELGFDGLLVTDALNMQGVAAHHQPGEMELKALLAGNDILLFPQNIAKAKAIIRNAIEVGVLSSADFNRKVKRVLRAKYFAGLADYKPISTENLFRELNNPVVDALLRKLAEASVTDISEKENALPISFVPSDTMAAIAIGEAKENDFQRMLKKYAYVQTMQISGASSRSAFDALSGELAAYSKVIISLHNMSRYHSKNFGLSKNTLHFIQDLAERTDVTLAVFGNPYSLKYFESIEQLLIAYEDRYYTQEAAAQAIFGGVPTSGSLPVSASAKYNYGKGNKQPKAIRLSYGIPEQENISSLEFKKIDGIVQEALDMKATPGCQVLVAKNGRVIFEKNYGFHTYDKVKPVRSTDLYDLASITKIAGSTVSLMHLYETGKINLDKTLSDYLPDLVNSNLEKLPLKNVLTHTSGLKPWVPFYAATIAGNSLYDAYYCYESDDFFCVKVAEDLYMRSDYVDSIKAIIQQTDLKRPGSYKYSDLGFYLFKEIIEKVTGKEMAQFLDQYFYQALGLRYMTYNPLSKFEQQCIVPTEVDTIFRKQTIQGYVHDPGAAMMGGISGHAGLFSNANDLAILMQMLLNEGEYAGNRFLQASTIKKFTKRQNNKSRRGLGFDKPEPEPDKGGPTCEDAPPEVYGHTGFTGTCAWVDPKNQLVYIFLSNRTYPSASNKKLITNDIRTRIQQVLYDAIVKGTGIDDYLVTKEKLTKPGE